MIRTNRGRSVVKAVALFFGLVALLRPTIATAQFYSNGPTPASEKLRTIDGEALRVIYPDYFDEGARSVLHYMKAMRSSVGYGLTTPQRVRVIIGGTNLLSNGMAMWAPLRVEMAGAPAINTYSTPWLKQLSVHEYRHIAQYGMLNRNAVGVVSKILGEQGSLIATGLMPFWFIEGDATDAETQATINGRGEQPSFSMHYRALGRTIFDTRRPDVWFSGSYRRYVPDHYELGYQLVTHANTLADRYVWGDVLDFSSRRPYLISSHQKGMKKFLGMNTPQLFEATFSSLNDFWEADTLRLARTAAWEAGQKNDLTPPNVRNWQRIEHPQWVDDHTIVAQRTSLASAPELITIDLLSGKTKRVARTGHLSTRPRLAEDGTLWWSEYQQSTFHSLRTGSVIRSRNLRSGGTRTLHLSQTALYPTPLPDGEVAFIEYRGDGSYHLLSTRGEEWAIPNQSIHGLAWSNQSGRYYMITLGDRGMGIISLDPQTGATEEIKAPAHITLRDLSAANGNLYFGSILSGVDNIHSLSLATLTEERITDAIYGAFDGAPSPSGDKLAYTLYSAGGYSLAIGAMESVEEEISYAEAPQNVVNPPRFDWGIPKIDTIDFSAEALRQSELEEPSRRYRRVGHLFDFHSYTPIYYNPESLMDGRIDELGLGATLLSQNITGDATTRIGYGYTESTGHKAEVSFNYLGFAPKFELSASWHQLMPKPTNLVRLFKDEKGNEIPFVQLYDNGSISFVAAQPQVLPNKNRDQISLYARTWLPIYLGGGAIDHFVTPVLEIQHTNNPYWDPDTRSYSSGRTMVYTSIQYSSSAKLAHRDFLPRWGVNLRATYGMGLNDSETSAVSLYGRLYAPGLAANHSLSLRANYQDLLGRGYYTWYLSDLFPRGTAGSLLPVDYSAFSVDYELPLFYPDGGIRGLVLLKRVRGGIGYDYAQYTSYFASTRSLNEAGLPNIFNQRSAVYSIGGSIVLDMVPLRMPSAAQFSLRLQLFVPSTTGKPHFGATIEMPL